MSRVVLDSSAILALLLNEPGRDATLAALAQGLVSTVNLSEVLLKLLDKGLTREEAVRELDDISLTVMAFTEADALQAAILRGPTKHAGLSFGDRACLALALAEGLPVLTGDRDWLRISVGVDVRMIRN